MTNNYYLIYLYESLPLLIISVFNVVEELVGVGFVCGV